MVLSLGCRPKFPELHAKLLHGAENGVLRGAGAQPECPTDVVDRSSLVMPQRKRRALERTEAIERGSNPPFDLRAFRQSLWPGLPRRVRRGHRLERLCYRVLLSRL